MFFTFMLLSRGLFLSFVPQHHQYVYNVTDRLSTVSSLLSSNMLIILIINKQNRRNPIQICHLYNLLTHL